MESYYVHVNDDVQDFAKNMIAALKRHGLKEKKTLPVDFLFLSGVAAYSRNQVDTKQSTWFSKLWGRSVMDLTNKITLHKKYADRDYLIESDILEQGGELPKLSGHILKILKPLGGFEGRGITVVTKTSQIEEWMSRYPQYKEWLLQNYIRNPALRDGYKFHLRIIVVVKKEHRKPVEVYVATHKFYTKGREKYKKDDWLNPLIHDTHEEEGETETFPQKLPDGWTEKEAAKIDNIINDSLLDLFEDEKDFRPDWNAKNGFEMFGVDVMFDKKKPYVLEVNNKVALDWRELYAAPLVDLILDGKIDPYFVRII